MDRIIYLKNYLALVKCADVLKSSKVDLSIIKYLDIEAEKYFNWYLDEVLNDPSTSNLTRIMCGTQSELMS